MPGLEEQALQKVVILGAGGFAREVLDVFEACNGLAPAWDVLGFVVEPGYAEAGTIVNGKPVLGGFDWLVEHVGEVLVTCGVGAPEHRRRLIEKARSLGCRFCNIVHPSVIASRWVTLGNGVVIAAGCILTNNIRVGDHAHLNLDCTIGHDATIGDFATLSPGVHVSGNVVIGEGAYLGTGANLIEKVRIGDWSVVGAGSAIVSDVPANSTTVGVPGKVIKRRPEGWHLGERNQSVDPPPLEQPGGATS